MSWLSKIKDLITRKNKKNKKEKKPEFIIPIPKKMNPEKVDPTRKVRECGVCKGDINYDEVMTKKAGFYMHDSCLKAARKFVGI